MMDVRDLRRILKEADPAGGPSMTGAERGRLRAEIVAAAEHATRRPGRAPWVALAAAAAVFIMMMLWSMRPAPTSPAKVERASTAPTRTVTRAPSHPVAATAAPAADRSRRAVLAARDRKGPPTRIDFTAPEGTRILWFVGTPDTKELGS